MSIARGEAGRKPFLPPKLVVFGSVKSLTQGPGGGSAFDGGSTMSRTGMGMGMGMSDPRAKENAALVGRHPLGFGLYLFDYRPSFQAKHGRGRQFGVMADEVEVLAPWAVIRASDGYRRVDYGALGIQRAAGLARAPDA
jgi:hypothetical protein